MNTGLSLLLITSVSAVVFFGVFRSEGCCSGKVFSSLHMFTMGGPVSNTSRRLESLWRVEPGTCRTGGSIQRYYSSPARKYGDVGSQGCGLQGYGWTADARRVRRDSPIQASFLSDVQGVLGKQQNTATLGLVRWWGRKEGSKFVTGDYYARRTLDRDHDRVFRFVDCLRALLRALKVRGTL